MAWNPNRVPPPACALVEKEAKHKLGRLGARPEKEGQAQAQAQEEGDNRRHRDANARWTVQRCSLNAIDTAMLARTKKKKE